MKVLIVDDEEKIREVLVEYAEFEGYECMEASDGMEAVKLVRENDFDVIIMDIMMPRLDGFSAVKEIKKIKDIPVLMLSARGEEYDKLFGFEIGIDDYVVKPFDADLFLLRVAALLRRAKIEADAELVAGNLTMNREEHTAYLNGEELPLTVREFDLLFKLLSYPKKTFTRSRLMTEFWDFDSSATSRTVDVYMAKLREKTAACDGFEIVTVHGLGYKAVLK